MSGVLSRRVFVWTGLAASLAGCATRPTLSTADPSETWPELEPLLAVTQNREALIIDVVTHGCAAQPDFVFRVDRKDGRAVIAFARRRLDTCKGEVGRTSLVFSYKALGLRPGERIIIANPRAKQR